MFNGLHIRLVVAVALTTVGSSKAHAQLDRVYPVSGSAATGTVVDARPDGVVVKVGSTNRAFPIDDIVKVTFEGDPPQLTRGRDFVVNGEYQSALDQLKQIDLSSIDREFIAADVAFYLAAAQARLALAGQGDKDVAMNNLRQFTGKFQSSWHFFEAAELLGDMATASGDFANATKFYAALSRSKSSLVVARGQYLLSLGQLRQGNVDEAITGLDQVLSQDLSSSAGIKLKTLASASRAVAIAKKGNGQEALEIVNQLVADLNPDDAEMAARIYNARGAANEALNKPQAALLDYLHTHLLFSSISDAHAEALSQLVKLWPQANQPERAAEARQELQTKYPGWGG